MTPQVARATCPDLALVLAIDASASIGDPEFALQIEGYSRAFRSPAVQAALRSAGDVEVALVLWGDGEMQAQIVPFLPVRGARGAEGFALIIAGLDRHVTGNTGIGRGLWSALDLLDGQASCAVRRVVNVSGDGKETLMARTRNNVSLPVARSRALTMGVVVNALAIETDTPDLAEWYGAKLVSGPGSFVITVTNLQSFASAIEKKLIREISLPLFAANLSETPRRPN